MWRRAVTEGFEQESEALFRFRLADAESLEHSRLQLGTVDTDAAAAQLEAVEHDVVGARHRRAGIALHLVDILERRRRERMMPREVALRLLVPLEEREVRYPQKLPGVGRNQVLVLRDADAQRAQDVPDLLLLAGDD